MIAGTPGSLKGEGGENMRLELILEPRKDLTSLPAFLQHITVAGRRTIGRLKESDISPAIQWARNLKEAGIVEEYSIGPITLEDVYLKAVGHNDTPESSEKEANNGAVAS